MRLPQVYVLGKDIQFLKDCRLSRLILDSEYRRTEAIDLNIIFPPLRTGLDIPIVTNVGRWGRYLILKLTTCTMIFRMAYKTMICVSTRTDFNPQARVKLEFWGRVKYNVFFQDDKSIGRFKVYPRNHTPDEFSALGLDILDDSFTPKYLKTESDMYLATLGDSRPLYIKPFLLNNSVIAWLDNEYASDALFIAGISPYYDLREGLPEELATVLVRSLRSVYLCCIEHRLNTTVSTVKVPPEDLFTVYDQLGEPCPSCNQRIVMTVLDGKKTFWCPVCQRNAVKSSC